ncbi:MAG: zinc ABC transporter substrate-binding protein [Lachnospiraceae bacterium]|nr:zinc ABC transporter substrate-binding protein [Lachnospiraceae bacterium]
MKKTISLIFITMMVICSLSACASPAGTSGDDKISIVTTIFPEYDWVMNVLGSNPANAEVTLLLDNGVDLHSYQPTVDDIMKIATCDMFIYVGGESDRWVEDVLSEAVNKDMVVINLLEVLGDSVKEEEVVEGMQEEDEHDHHHDEDGDGEHHHHDEDETEYDEHVWLSLKNAVMCTEAISHALQDKVDPENSITYAENAAEYMRKLFTLDRKYEETIANASGDTLLFGDRFPFRYLTDDYDLNYYAAFAGCSAETEASFETVTFLAGKVDELSLGCILTIETSDGKIAETIRDNTSTGDQKILVLNSIQSVTMDDINNGVTYLSIMKENLNVLSEALN